MIHSWPGTWMERLALQDAITNAAGACENPYGRLCGNCLRRAKLERDLADDRLTASRLVRSRRFLIGHGRRVVRSGAE